MTLLNPPELVESEISKADQIAHDALVELIELIAMKDPRYNTGSYPQAMQDAADSVIDTFVLRNKDGGLV